MLLMLRMTQIQKSIISTCEKASVARLGDTEDFALGFPLTKVGFSLEVCQYIKAIGTA